MSKKLTTQEYNLKILDCLRYYIKKYPELRFQQILTNLNLIKDNNPLYNEESKETYNLLDNYINSKNNKNKSDKTNLGTVLKNYVNILKENEKIKTNLKNNIEDEYIKEYMNNTQKSFEDSIEYAFKTDNTCIKQNHKNYFNDNIYDKKQCNKKPYIKPNLKIDNYFKNKYNKTYFNNYLNKIKNNKTSQENKTKLSLNEFNDIIKEKCANVIHNYFYDLYELDDRSIIINNIYHYLWRNFIILNVNIEELINNCFKTLPKVELTDNYLYDIHLYILSQLFNTYIQIKYNYDITETFNNNILRFEFQELQNDYYHGSISDKTMYELTYTFNPEFISTFKKIKDFVYLYNDIKTLLKSNNGIEYNINELNNNKIFEIDKNYINEINILMEELEN